jgi:uncharacterized protein (DUF362 family)/Pyruvate/2-oxoacid:ferredoxin oxidoreductase delta subunit
MDIKKSVAILKCRGYARTDVYSTVKEAVELLGGIERFVKPGERILLKPNLLAPKDPGAAVTTHPAIVEAAIRLVSEAGATPVVGDSPGLGSARKNADKAGVLDVCRATATEFVEFKEAVAVENTGGLTFKRLEIAREALEVDGIINLAKLKTHAQMYLTLGVKNLFGCVPGKRKPQWHLAAGVDSLYFASMILDLYLYLKPRLTIMDGIVGMEGNGPASGDPVDLGLVFAGADAVAMDMVITEVLGAAPELVPILKAAMGRGIEGLKNIEVVGETIEDVRVAGFRFPPVVSVNFADRLPYFIDRRIRKALTSRPHVNDCMCTLCNMCVEVCPTEVMAKTDRISIDYDSCIRCYCCQEMCPEGAISSREGWLKRIIPGL